MTSSGYCSIKDEKDDSENITDTYEECQIDFRFRIAVKVKEYDAYYCSDKSYVTGNRYIYVAPHETGIYRVFPLTSVRGYELIYNNNGHLDYGYCGYPMNLDSAQYFNELRFRNIYIPLAFDNSTGTYTINEAGYGYYCPCEVKVIRPEEVAKNPGDIYDRFYTTETPINVTHVASPGWYSGKLE